MFIGHKLKYATKLDKWVLSSIILFNMNMIGNKHLFAMFLIYFNGS